MTQAAEHLAAGQTTELDAKRAAQVLGVHVKEIYTYIHNGELQAWNKAKDPKARPHYRISIQSLEDFKASRVVRPAAKPQPPRRWGQIRRLV